MHSLDRVRSKSGEIFLSFSEGDVHPKIDKTFLSSMSKQATCRQGCPCFDQCGLRQCNADCWSRHMEKGSFTPMPLWLTLAEQVGQAPCLASASEQKGERRSFSNPPYKIH